jgi:ribosome-binding protein aMBF1 (putative translation factor)
VKDAQRSTHPASVPASGQVPNDGRGGRKSIDVFVGQRLRARRLELGLTHDDLAPAIRMPAGWIASYERGEERIMAAHMCHFTELLGVNLWYFFVRA